MTYVWSAIVLDELDTLQDPNVSSAGTRVLDWTRLMMKHFREPSVGVSAASTQSPERLLERMGNGSVFAAFPLG